MNNLFLIVLAGLLASCVFDSDSSGTDEGDYVSEYCQNSANKTKCGVIVYGNAGAYTVSPVKVTAESSQPSGAPINSACLGLEGKLSYDVNAGEYVTFTMPASCLYELKISIVLGNDKSKNLYLTPGCEIVAETDGTVDSNDWKSIKSSYINGQSGTPVDSDGNKCGTESNM